jgi:hypothetical protein
VVEFDDSVELVVELALVVELSDAVELAPVVELSDTVELVVEFFEFSSDTVEFVLLVSVELVLVVELAVALVVEFEDAVVLAEFYSSDYNNRPPELVVFVVSVEFVTTLVVF